MCDMFLKLRDSLEHGNEEGWLDPGEWLISNV